MLAYRYNLVWDCNCFAQLLSDLMHYKAKAVLTLMWKKCFIYPFPHLLFSLWSFLFDGGYTKCLGLITMSLLYWHQHLQILFQKVSSILMLTVFFWWRIDFRRIILGSVLRPLCQFSPKSQTSSQVSINLLCKLIASYIWLVYDGWAAT